jgi:hypothetical protein
MLTITLNLPSHIAKRLSGTSQEVAYYRKSMVIVMFNDGDLTLEEARGIFDQDPGETTFEEFWSNASHMATSGPYTEELRHLVDTDN